MKLTRITGLLTASVIVSSGGRGAGRILSWVSEEPIDG
jgi:hypothetical protein